MLREFANWLHQHPLADETEAKNEWINLSCKANGVVRDAVSENIFGDFFYSDGKFFMELQKAYDSITIIQRRRKFLPDPLKHISLMYCI